MKVTIVTERLTLITATWLSLSDCIQKIDPFQFDNWTQYEFMFDYLMDAYFHVRS